MCKNNHPYNDNHYRLAAKHVSAENVQKFGKQENINVLIDVKECLKLKMRIVSSGIQIWFS